jgi:hypothetical protein
VTIIDRFLVRPGLSAAKKLVRAKAESAMKRPFYSAVDKAIEDIVGKQPKGTGDQYLAMILKTKGVKPAEVKDRGIDKALQGKGKMSGQDLVSVAEERPPVALKEKQIFEADDAQREGMEPGVFYGGEEWGHYRTPGGSNYREIMFKMPQEKKAVKKITADELRSKGYEVRNLEYDPKKNLSSFKVYDKDGNLVSSRSKVPGVAYPEQALIYEANDMTKVARESANAPIYKSEHFGDEGKNLLAHARVQDMTGPNGEKIMLVDEIQSDWHQLGRKEGYVDLNRLNDLDAKLKAEGKLSPEEAEEYNRLTNQAYMPKTHGGVPDAPFKKNWHELVMKRLVDDAAKGGYDRVIITPGAEQANRYSLEKVVDEINVVGRTDAITGEKTRQVALDTVDGRSLRFGVDNNGVIDNVSDSFIENFKGKNLSEVVGEGVAKNIMSGGTQTISGEGLRVGGKGMKRFYDQILPSYIKNQYGVEVGQHPLKLRDFEVVRENRGEGFAVIRPGGGTVAKYPTMEEAQAAADQLMNVQYHSFDITPEMRNKIIDEGQSFYQLAPVAGAIGAGMMATDEEPTEYKKGGKVKKPVSLDAMRLAVMSK